MRRYVTEPAYSPDDARLTTKKNLEHVVKIVNFLEFPAIPGKSPRFRHGNIYKRNKKMPEN